MGLELASAIQSGDTLHSAKITTRLPREGDELMICGFKASEKAFAVAEKVFKGKFIVSKGLVTARYTVRRDSVLLPSPCLEVSCSTWGGMSGGPVFDSLGNLVGILSTSVGDLEGGHPSFVSLLFPALAARFEGGWPPGVIPQPARLIDLPQRVCYVDNRDAIRYSVDPSTGSTTYEYRPWE
jgi:hypothetical protein